MMNVRSNESFEEVSNAGKCHNSISDSLSRNISYTVSKKKDYILRWIHGKYCTLPLSDVEDIAQESCIDLWEWCQKQSNCKFSTTDFINLWKAFCRNKITHLIKKEHHYVMFDVTKHDISSENMANDITFIERETLYYYLNTMKESDRLIITMTMQGYSQDDICKMLGYKNKTVLKNIKCRLIKKIRHDITSLESWKVPKMVA